MTNSKLTGFDLAWREQSPSGLHDLTEPCFGLLVSYKGLAGVVAARVSVLACWDVKVHHKPVEGEHLIGVSISVAITVLVPGAPGDDIGQVLSLPNVLIVGLLEFYELLLSNEAYPQECLFELIKLNSMLEIVDLWLVLDELTVVVVGRLERRDCLTLDILLESLFSVGTLPFVGAVLKHQNICDPKVLDKKLELSHEESIGVVGERNVGGNLLDVEIMKSLDGVVIFLVRFGHCLVKSFELFLFCLGLDCGLLESWGDFVVLASGQLPPGSFLKCPLGSFESHVIIFLPLLLVFDGFIWSEVPELVDQLGSQLGIGFLEELQDSV